MGVYLPNMEMPIDCIKCPFCLFADGHWKCLVDGSHADFGGTCRPQRCPLVPVPTPHGRMIDADEIVRYKERLVVDADKINPKIRYVVDTKYIDDAPTIIPAEPSNNLSKPCKEEAKP